MLDYGHTGPPIHKLKSGHRYPNNVMDLDREGNQNRDRVLSRTIRL